MANLPFDVSLGLVVTYALNVKNNTPSTSVLGVLALASTGLEIDSVLRTKTTVAALVSGSTNEATNTGYSRATITDSDLSGISFSPDTTNHNVIIDTPDVLLGTVQAGDNISKIVFYYDSNPATTTDSTRIPLVMFDFFVIPNGSQITANVLGIYKEQAP